MTALSDNNIVKTTPKQKIVRDQKGRFVSSSGKTAKQNIQDINIYNNSIPNQPIQPTSPVSTGATLYGKETQPNAEEIFLEEAEKTRELKEQLAELEKTAEVKEIKGEIELPEIVKKQGVEVVGESAPISTQNNIVLPLDDTKIYQVIKKIKNFHQDIKLSIAWLAVWCIRQLAKLHIKLKEVQGKVVREDTT